VLLPGAGLGRLCVEVSAAGFEAQGNEFSYFMLIAASFMLNATACADQWTIHPWVHLTCNNITDADQLRGVAVPDVVPSDMVPPGMLSMCAGDFAVRAQWCCYRSGCMQRRWQLCSKALAAHTVTAGTT
jgi:carnosine N-methyltransferase